MSSTTGSFGLEMLLKLEKENVTEKTDMLIIFVHWILVCNGFRNVGVGDDGTLDNAAETSELLPEGWNSNKTSYKLRYKLKGALYVVYGTFSSGTMIVNLLHANSLKSSNVAFNVDATIEWPPAEGNAISVRLIKNIDEQNDRLQKELLAALDISHIPWVICGNNVIRYIIPDFGSVSVYSESRGGRNYKFYDISRS